MGSVTLDWNIISDFKFSKVAIKLLSSQFPSNQTNSNSFSVWELFLQGKNFSFQDINRGSMETLCITSHIVTNVWINFWKQTSISEILWTLLKPHTMCINKILSECFYSGIYLHGTKGSGNKICFPNTNMFSKHKLCTETEISQLKIKGKQPLCFCSVL